MQTNQKKSGKSFFFNLLKVIGLIIWAILPLNFSMILNLTQEETAPFLRWILAAVWILFTLFSIRWIWRYYLKVYPDPLPKMQGKDIGIALLLFLFLRVVAVAGTLANQQLSGNEMTSNDALLFSDAPLAIAPVYFFLFNLTIGFVAPVLEELVFRGVFSRLLFKWESFWLPAVITSAVFSLMHGFDNLLTFSMYFIIGLTLFYSYRRRNNIKDSILLHILNNSLAVILSVVTYLVLYFQ